MSLDIDEAKETSIESQLYMIDPDENTTGQALVGVAKRRFNEDHGTSYCRAQQLFTYNGFAVVIAYENPFRDWKDGDAITVIRDNWSVAENYYEGDQQESEEALDYLAAEMMRDQVGDNYDYDKARELIERLLEMLA
jgi:hypothetical protein